MSDGVIAIGEPSMAAWWYPSNDHPLDKATAEFIAHAERVAGRQLNDLFQTWLYTSGKPAVSPNDPF